MADHGRAECAKGFVADLDRAGDVQFDVVHKKACETFHKRKGMARGFSPEGGREVDLQEFLIFDLRFLIGGLAGVAFRVL